MSLKRSAMIFPSEHFKPILNIRKLSQANREARYSVDSLEFIMVQGFCSWHQSNPFPTPWLDPVLAVHSLSHSSKKIPNPIEALLGSVICALGISAFFPLLNFNHKTKGTEATIRGNHQEIPTPPDSFLLFSMSLSGSSVHSDTSKRQHFLCFTAWHFHFRHSHTLICSRVFYHTQ